MSQFEPVFLTLNLDKGFLDGGRQESKQIEHKYWWASYKGTGPTLSSEPIRETVDRNFDSHRNVFRSNSILLAIL